MYFLEQSLQRSCTRNATVISMNYNSDFEKKKPPGANWERFIDILVPQILVVLIILLTWI